MGLWDGVLVVDTTSAIALIEEANRLDLFRELGSRSKGLEVPDTVLNELEEDLSYALVKLDSEVAVFEARELEPFDDLFNRYPRLGSGELGVIAKGIRLEDQNRRYTCVLDDGHARSVGKRKDLAITGTIGLLLQLEEDSVIDRDEHEQILLDLKAEGFRYDWDNHPLGL